MVVKKFNTRIQLKNDTSVNWSSANLALLAGEFAWDSTNNNFKIGDGSSIFSALNYAIPVADGTTIVSANGENKYKTLSVGSIGTDKVTSLSGYSLGSTNYSALATTDTLNQALAKLEAGVNAAAAGGVQSIGGATGTVTLGNGLTSTTGANGSVSTLVNGYIVNNAGTNTNALDIDSAKIDSAYTVANTTNLATVGTVTAAIGTLDVSDITGFGVGKTLATLTETDGKIAATFQDISIKSSQINDLSNTYASDGTVAITGTGVAAALGTLDGSHDVATASAHTPGNAESATYKLEIFDATQTDGIVSTNNSAAETLYFSQAYSAANPIITQNDIGSLTGAMHFIDTVDGTNKTLPTTGQTAGDVYIVSADGTYAGQACEVGDMIIWNGNAWNVVTGENQVTPVSGGAELVAGAAATSIGVVDGVTLTAKTSVTAGSATIATASEGIVTIKAGVTQGTGTGTIANSTGTDITLAKVATSGAASDVSIADSGEIFTATNVEDALSELKNDIRTANMTIDGHKGAITTGNGLSHVQADNGFFAVLIDSSNANGLSVGSNGVAMAQATGASFGTVKVTSGNGLTLTDGTVSYAHNTTAVNIASKDSTTNIITVQGTLTPDASDAITTSNAVTFASVAATGDASDLSVTSAPYGGSSNVTNAQDALDNLSDNLSNHTHNIEDLTQGTITGDNTIIFDCGTATTCIANVSNS